MDKSTPVEVLKGFTKTDNHLQPETVYPGQQGETTVEIRELERIQLQFGEFKTTGGWLKVGQQLRPLPIGSRFDGDRGTFPMDARTGMFRGVPVRVYRRRYFRATGIEARSHSDKS